MTVHPHSAGHTVMPGACPTFAAQAEPRSLWCGTCSWRSDMHRGQTSIPTTGTVVMRLAPTAPDGLALLDASNPARTLAVAS